MLLASIPSPAESVIELGPLRLTAYGLMIALGVIAAYEMTRRRWKARGGDPEDVAAIVIWAVPAGLIGARLYHVATDWNRLYADAPADAIKIWDGGLGIPGGILAGVLVGIYIGRRRGMRIGPGLDAVAPALPLAQAIGRLGNWWNQERRAALTSIASRLPYPDDEIVLVFDARHLAGVRIDRRLAYLLAAPRIRRPFSTHDRHCPWSL